MDDVRALPIPPALLRTLLRVAEEMAVSPGKLVEAALRSYVSGLREARLRTRAEGRRIAAAAEVET
jgi:hypothetical protein